MKKFLKTERNVARDTKLAQIPTEGIEKTARIRTGETKKVVEWGWEGETRVFLLPREFADILMELPFTRDVIMAVGHIYLQQGCPPDGKIKTTAREIAATLGLQWKGDLAVKIEDALTLARLLTIRNTRRKIQKGKIWYERTEIYGFLDSWTRIQVRDGRAIPANSQPIMIQLSPEFASALRNEFVIRIPLSAIQAARRAPARCRVAAKNIVFYLASLQPLECVTISASKLRGIAGITTRGDRASKTIQKCLTALQGVVVKKWEKEGDKYHIWLYPQGV